MIGMGNIASHNIFPYFIYFNQKYLRLNKVKIPNNLDINEDILKKYIEELKLNIKLNDINEINDNLLKNESLSHQVKIDITEFLNLITIKKI